MSNIDYEYDIDFELLLDQRKVYFYEPTDLWSNQV